MLKILSRLTLLIVCVVAFACEDPEIVSTSTSSADQSVAPPPSGLPLYARTSAYTTGSADVYYQINYPIGNWTYIGTITDTFCRFQGNIPAGSGDVVRFAMIHPTTGAGISYRGVGNYSCSSFPGTLYCGDLQSGDSYYTITIGDADAISLEGWVFAGTLQPCPM